MVSFEEPKPPEPPPLHHRKGASAGAATSARHGPEATGRHHGRQGRRKCRRKRRPARKHLRRNRLRRMTCRRCGQLHLNPRSPSRPSLSPPRRRHPRSHRSSMRWRRHRPRRRGRRRERGRTCAPRPPAWPAATRACGAQSARRANDIALRQSRRRLQSLARGRQLPVASRDEASGLSLSSKHECQSRNDSGARHHRAERTVARGSRSSGRAAFRNSTEACWPAFAPARPPRRCRPTSRARARASTYR